MDKRFLAILGIIVVIIIGGIWIADHKKSGGSGGGNASPTNHVTGNTSSPVKLQEYGDYECPYCGQYYPIVKQVVTMYNKQISFQFSNLPLTQLHPNAFAAARAAEAASLQGKFWQMHDLLYQNQNEWVNSSNPESVFVNYANQLGLNSSQFKSDYSSDKVNNSINADVSAFNKTGAQEATPTFFLNGKQVQPTEGVTSFVQLINAELKKNGITPNPTTSTSTTSSTNSNSAPTSNSSSSSNGAPQSKQ
jgi:protein-disulfide isomerase